MKKTLLTISACILATIGFSQAWNYPWATGIGSAEDDDDGVVIAIDSEDNVYMAAEYEGALSIGGSDYPAPADNGRDVLVVKYNSSGEVLWSGSIAGEGFSNGFLFGDMVSDIHVDQDDNVIVIGNIGTNGVVFGTPNGIAENRNYIIKISAEGQVLWEVYADENYLGDELTTVTSDPDGNIYVGGRTDETAGSFYALDGVELPVEQSTDWMYLMAKISSEGTVEYIELLPTGVPTRIQLDTNGDFIISSQNGDNEVGNYALQKISASDFSIIWERETTEDGQDTSQGGNMGFHVKSDNSIVQFLKTTSTIEYPDADAADCNLFCSMGVLVNIDAEGNTISTHTMESLVDNPQWVGLTGLNYFPVAFEAIDDDTYYIAGRLQGNVEFSNGFLFQPSESYLGNTVTPSDAFVMMVDEDLNILEYASQTGTAVQVSSDLAIFSNGDAALAGVHEIETFGGLTGNTVFGEDELSGFGGEDYFLTRVVTGTEAPLGVNEIDNQLSFSIFPNPSDQFTNLVFENPDGTNALIDVIDITGKIVLSERIAGNGIIQHQMETSRLTPGLYTIRLTTETSVGTKTFVVNR